MDVSIITSLVSSLGFPIVMCVVMAYYIKYRDDKNRDEITSLNDKYMSLITDLNERHKEETESLKQSIDNNTTAIQELSNYISIKE